MATISEFLQNYMSLMQLREGMKQNRINEASARATQLAGFLQLARNTTDPKMLEGLTTTFEELGVADRATLSQLLSLTAPTQEVIQSGAVARGIGAVQGTSMEPVLNRETAFRTLTGAGSGSAMQETFLGDLFSGASLPPSEKAALAQGLLTRTATGLAPGEFAMSRVLAGRPEETLIAGTEIGLGTRMNAAQGAAHDLNQRQQGFSEWMGRQNIGLEQGRLSLGWAGLRQQERQFTSEFALRQAAATAEAAASGRVPPSAVPDLLSTQRQMMADLQKNAHQMTSPQIKQYMQAIDNTGAALQSAGYSGIRLPRTPEGDYDVDQIFRRNFLSRTRGTLDLPR